MPEAEQLMRLQQGIMYLTKFNATAAQRKHRVA